MSAVVAVNISACARQAVGRPHLAAVPRLVVASPGRVGEGVEEVLGHVVRAGGAVEVDDDGANGQGGLGHGRQATLRGVDERERMLRFAVEAWRRRTAVCGGEVHEVDGLVVCLTGVPAEWFNATLVVDPGPDVGAAIDRARALYPPDLGFGMEVLPDLHPQAREVVEGRGWRAIDVSPVMTLEVDALRTPPAPEGLEVVRVTDPATLDEVAAIDAAAFGGDAGVTRRFLPDAIFDDPGSACTRAGSTARWSPRARRAWATACSASSGWPRCRRRAAAGSAPR